MKKSFFQITLVIGLLASLIAGCGKSSQTDYLIATHYFADEWPINFWNAEWDNLDTDLQRISSDGFNTVIVVVPWREFQPEMNPVSYNEDAIERLELFIHACSKYNLKVQLRLGYLNDYYAEENSSERFYSVLGDEAAKVAWIDFAETIYSTCKIYQNFVGGFITWEDFWHNYMLVDYVGGTESALTFAKMDGFGAYIESKYTLDEFNKIFSTSFVSYDEICVPSRDDYYVAEWFYFVDEFTTELLEQTKEVFPVLSMEVRTDADWMMLQTGEEGLVNHESTWECADSEYTAIMYKPSQGAILNKNGISSDEALKNFDSWLKNIYDKNGNKPIYIEQFLYTDNTPGYSHGNILDDEELAKYLSECDEVLKKYTNGYGVWVYRDYCNNMLFNPQFALDTEGWESIGAAEVVDYKGSNAIKLQPMTQLHQTIPVWRKMSGEEYYVSLDYSMAERSVLSVTVGTQEQCIELEGEGTLELTFSNQEDISLRIVPEKECVIDNIKVYSFIQTQKLYNIDNKEQKAVEAIRVLNKKLS